MYPPIYPPVLSRQSTGSLIVETTTDPAIGPLRPLPGIQITVKERQATGERIVAQLVTNANGQTPVIQLPAPPSELTEEPQTTETPFSPYIIEAQGENVIPTQINGTQIFSTIRSIQPIRLTPVKHLYPLWPQDKT